MALDPSSRPVSLRTRLSLLALVFLGLVLVAAGLSAWTVRSWDQNLDRRGNARAAVDLVAELRLSYSEQEAALRSYLLTSDEAALRSYGVARAGAERSIARLDDADDPDLQRQLDAVVAASDAWYDGVARPILDGATVASSDDALDLEMSTELRRELDGLEQLTTDASRELDDENDRLRRNAVATLVASAIGAVIATVLVIVLFRRWITQPLARIREAAIALGSDDTAAMPSFQTRELHDVVDAIRSLQSSLVASRDAAVVALDALEQSAVLALQVRAELADELGDMPAGWAIESMLIPAEGVVAGDCYDVGLLDAHRIYAVLIDVTGHGAVAALDALKAKGQLRAGLRSRLSPGATLDWLSREQRHDDSELLTAVVLVVDVTTGECQYANAGHPPLLIVDDHGVRALEPTGPLLGAFPATWHTETFTLAPGSTLLLHTDGVTDTLGAERERFGDERLHTCLTVTEPTALIECVRTAVEEFRDGPRSDDVSAIALHRRSITREANDVDTVQV